MISSRLLANFKIICDSTLSTSFSSSGKFHVIKILNCENKYLFGNLIETQKERRKKIVKDVNKAFDDKSITTNCSEGTPRNEVHDDYETRPADKELTKTRAKKSKSSKKFTTDVDSQIPSKSELPKLTTDEFIFKSAIPLNEENYPLSNPEKCQLFSQECAVKNVYNYTFSDSAVKSFMKFPSVSKIIEDTMSDRNKQILDRWRQNMIKELGEDGFRKQNEASKARGGEFHAAVLHRVLNREVGECSEVTRNALNSLSWLLDEVTHPMAVESVIAHPTLGYKGVFDCVALFRNIPVVIDWKLSDKPKKDLKDTYDAPVQVTAYIGAINHDPNYKWAVDHGLVAVAYTSGDPCDVFLLAPKHCQIYWKHWLQRLEKFKARSHLHLDHEIDEKALQLT
ncbi:mitochondrial genome maintenance exonuclease 1-like [Macrosteles quadrilineatus]|uniref:mitochondrial genome maintenance exonuclease 1-like n=1 Tax=Macrosteles quadrilineatus TaxID=74068 RepID=UPI0023E2FCD2|nr:mitochondrial genome maintenance exonuclease 1-like [Macrosteles quadrilineatus]